MGVRRAVDLALECSCKSKENIYTLGPLIHNNQTVQMLKERGIISLEESDTPPKNSTVLIRAHGVAPNVQKLWEESCKIIDGTCPKVKAVHKVIEKYQNMGYTIIIAGDSGHAEVIGLQGYAQNKAYIINKPEDIKKLPELKKICLVSQTTFDSSLFDDISKEIQKHFNNNCDIIIKKTICSATEQRQNEIKELAKKVDTIIIVGGKNSANTKRLASIAESSKKPVQWVETENEILWEKLANCKTIGITAGASTPNWMIRRITDYISYMAQSQKKDIVSTIRKIIDILSNINIFTATAASFIYYVSCILQEIIPSKIGFVVSFLYFFSMYLWNSLGSIESTQHLGISRYKFYREYKSLLYIMVGLCIVVLLSVSFFVNRIFFYLMLFSTVAGSLYHVTIVPPFLKKILRYGKLKDIPMSRDLFVALAWAVVLTFIPAAEIVNIEFNLVTICLFLLIFVFGFLRSLIFDLRDIEGDRIMGRETLVTIIGEQRAKTLITVVIAITGLICAFSPVFSTTSINLNVSKGFFLQIIPLFYLYFFMKFNKKYGLNKSSLFNILAEGHFYLSGISAFIATII